jgi:hypothetical protein
VYPAIYFPWAAADSSFLSQPVALKAEVAPLNLATQPTASEKIRDFVGGRIFPLPPPMSD